MSSHRTAADLIRYIESGQRVFVHGGSATPTVLLDALVEQAPRLRDVELIHIHTEGAGRHAEPELAASFRVVNLFVGANMRDKLDGDRVDYLPCFLSEIPLLFRSRRRRLDVALLHLSPPDRHGFCTLGTSVDVARAAFDAADLVLAQINPRMPRVHGDGTIHIDEIDHHVEVDVPLPEARVRPPSEEARLIGGHVAGLVEDGACLQVGIGAVPDAVLAALAGHRHLGVHTEMWSDGVLALLRCGAVDNSRKVVVPGKTVSAFIVGSRAVYDYIDDNPTVIQLGVDQVNNPAVIARNPRVTSINSAIEIDLTGQVCADSVGHRIISGVGGQMDFMRGAALSERGKPIIAMTSRTRHGASRIVAALAPGAGVVTTRAHVHHVVTEYGVADLYGRTLGERAAALIAIAHPDDRDALARAAFASTRR
ncbi:MAG TPA: acetyl-CoA hydrolase/transferase C-terminal domain-containing protein [Kofleriaceae bacterium]|jgi:acyl-CoA hydrolase|nr:acetyl-CoA hydrolase/transferase C-terminal domain-containing protein [Kofleriaceae bacterium]